MLCHAYSTRRMFSNHLLHGTRVDARSLARPIIHSLTSRSRLSRIHHSFHSSPYRTYLIMSAAQEKKQEADFTKEVDELLPQTEQLAKVRRGRPGGAQKIMMLITLLRAWDNTTERQDPRSTREDHGTREEITKRTCLLSAVNVRDA